MSHQVSEDPSGFSRRDFMRYLAAGSALSVAALDKLNAGIYQSITELNQKYVKEIAPDGRYWDAIRDKFMFQDGLIMMNNGTVGPLPKPVFKYFDQDLQGSGHSSCGCVHLPAYQKRRGP